MALPANWIKSLVIYGSDQKSPFVNVTYWTMSATPADPPLVVTAWNAAFAGAIRPVLKDFLGAESTYWGTFSALSVSGSVYTDFNNSGAGAGDQTGDDLPDYCAAIIQKRTAAAGRSGRGRWFLGCVPEILTDTGKLTEDGHSYATAIADVLGTAQDVGGVTFTPCLLANAGVDLIPLTSTSAQLVLGTQRRRRLRAAY